MDFYPDQTSGKIPKRRAPGCVSGFGRQALRKCAATGHLPVAPAPVNASLREACVCHDLRNVRTRRCAMNANLIHKWLRDPRFLSSDQAVGSLEAEGATFLPIEVVRMTPVPAAPISPTPSSISTTAQRLDITLSDGRRILVEGPTALSSVLTLVEGLAQ